MITQLYSDVRSLRNKTEKYHFDTVRFKGATLVHKWLETCYESLFDIMHEMAEVIIVSIQEELTPTEFEVWKDTDIIQDTQIKDLQTMLKEVYDDLEDLKWDFYDEIKSERDLVIQNILQDEAKQIIKLCWLIYSLLD